MITLKCPKCGGKTRIIWVRHKKEFTVRSRECVKCGYRFITKEALEDYWDYKQILLNIYNELNEVFKNRK